MEKIVQSNLIQDFFDPNLQDQIMKIYVRKKGFTMIDKMSKDEIFQDRDDNYIEKNIEGFGLKSHHKDFQKAFNIRV